MSLFGAPSRPFSLDRAVLMALLAIMVLGVLCAACSDDPGFLPPTLGDFVQFTDPEDGEVVQLDDIVRRPIVAFLNFLPAEGRFGFGSLQSFRFDGREVRDEVQILLSGGPPPEQASLSFEPDSDDLDPGDHEVELVYADSRGTVHQVRWEFTIED